MKAVVFEKDKVHAGFKKAVRAVSCTLGPQGKNVFLADPTLPRFTNDGASIANKIILPDHEEDTGAWVVRSATAKTADEVGDQTTTTAVLAGALFEEMTHRKESAVILRRSLKEALPKIAEKIKDLSHKTTLKDIIHIAEVSAEDKNLAALITEIFQKKGVEAQITVADSENGISSIEMKDGYEAKVGMMSPWFVTNIQKQTAEYQDVGVLCTHKKVDSITQLLPVYEKLGEKKITKLVIVCEDMDVAALGAIVDNKRRGTFSTLVIRATGELLDDIAAVVGAVPVSEGTGTDFADQDILKKLGMAASVVSTFGSPTTPGRTVFVGKKNTGKQRAQLLESQAKNVSNQFERDSILKRVGKLNSGVAVLKLGAYSEQELGYLRDKADDAIKAVRSALEEGYIEGGGMTLYRIAEALEPKTIGDEVLKNILSAPLRKIVENAGEDYAQVIKNLPKGKGYDAREGTYKDLIKEGIIDPAKGARVAVESAVSSVCEMLIADCFVVDYEKAEV